MPLEHAAELVPPTSTVPYTIQMTKNIAMEVIKQNAPIKQNTLPNARPASSSDSTDLMLIIAVPKVAKRQIVINSKDITDTPAINIHVLKNGWLHILCPQTDEAIIKNIAADMFVIERRAKVTRTHEFPVKPSNNEVILIGFALRRGASSSKDSGCAYA
jgi:hypothetical protein